MGVHDLSAYPAVKSELGIPQDEPIFILRAQDILYGPTIHVYAALYQSVVRELSAGLEEPEKMFVDHLYACMTEGRRWQQRHHDLVKVPD